MSITTASTRPYYRPWLAVLLLCLGSICGSVAADDTEIFFRRSADNGFNNRPNILLLINNSITMSAALAPTTTDHSAEPQHHYDPATRYPGNQYISGGSADDEYYYLYQRRQQPKGLAELVYYNRLHRDQLRCTLLPAQFNESPYHSVADDYLLNNSDAGDLSLSSDLCAASDPDCSFSSGPEGPEVSCRSQSESLTAVVPTIAEGSSKLLAVTGNFHNFLQGYYTYPALQGALRYIVDQNYPVNITLMKFNDGNGGYIAQSALAGDNISDQQRLALQQVIDSPVLTPTSQLTESLWEAWLYLSGGEARYGGAGDSSAFSRDSNYRSPVTGACQNSKIVILAAADGQLNNDSDPLLKQIIGVAGCGGDHSCADDFSQWLHSKQGQRRDHSPLSGMQTIDVEVIELGGISPLPLFKRIATHSSYRQVTTTAQLQQALRHSFETTAVTANSFMPATLPVDSYQRIGLNDELYFALLQPGYSQRWGGNIKKYRLREGKIVDANGLPAIDTETGFFAADALSQWSSVSDWLHNGDTSPDGAVVERGGFAYRLALNEQRKIYTYIGPSPGVGNRPITLNKALLLRENTSKIDPVSLGLNPDSPDWRLQRRQIIRWASGADPAGRNISGDFIHGRPAVVSYRRDSPCQGSDCVDHIVFAPSNLGLLYAIDGATGDEIFSFIPQELLPNLGHYYRNEAITTDKKYGLDGPISLWHKDHNNNGHVDQDDHVYLYLAMRRGGKHYYALDVSDRNSPKLLWQIDGANSGDFRDLAQTWSVPKKATVRWHCSNTSCSSRDVLFFGGGYDPRHDNATAATTGDRGNALYMVDAKTGILLWSAGQGAHHSLTIPQMENSITADLSVNDVDEDGYSELVIAVDVQGNVWRFDINPKPIANGPFANGGKIANFSGDGRAFRRFYNAPDVAYFSSRGERPFLTISISSGYRAAPNSREVDDRLFVLYDYHPLGSPEDDAGRVNYNYGYNGDVLSATDLGDIDSGSATMHGWFKVLSGGGEKGLSPTLTFDGKIVLTTYIPSEGCDNDLGDSRVYILDALTGASRHPDNVPFQTLRGTGIAPQPLVIATRKTHCNTDCGSSAAQLQQRNVALVCIGTYYRDDLLPSSVQKTFWRENR